MPSIKSRRNIPTGDERHNKSKSGHSGRQPHRQSTRRPVGTISAASDITDTTNRNSKPRSGSALLLRSELTPRRSLLADPYLRWL